MDRGDFSAWGMRGFELGDAEICLAEEVAPLASMMASWWGRWEERGRVLNEVITA